jgi:dGTPase
LGDTNGTIVYTLVEDLITNSLEKPYVSFSVEVGEALKRLKEFNEEHIYMNYKVKEQTSKVRLMFELLFKKYFQDLKTGDERSDIYRKFLDGISAEYRERTQPAEIVRDFIAGMTDDYFLNQCHKYLIPQIKNSFF